MSKTLKEVALTTAGARRALHDGLHWRRIDHDVHLGYRKSKRSGTWVVRWRVGPGYRQVALGTADDALKAGNLSYDAATRDARKKVEEARVEAEAAAAGPLPTVRSAVEQYVAIRDDREEQRRASGRVTKPRAEEAGEEPARSDAGQRLGRYVLGTAKRGLAPPGEAPVANIPLHKLRESDLRAWLEGLPPTMKPATRQRLATDFKAALNAACDRNRDHLPATIPEAVKRGLKVEVGQDEGVELGRDNQILTDGQVTRILAAAKVVDNEAAWDGDLYRLLVVMAGTGMRFSQVARMRVRDVQRDNRRLLVPVSRKGKGTKQGFVPVPVAEDVLEVLLPCVVGRAAGDFLLERWRYGQAPGSIAWIKDRRGPWESSSEFSRDWQLIKHRAELAHADPYSLRHSSIVRGLRANLPIRLVAAQHDTSVGMIEKHYSRHIVDGLEELVARAVVTLVPVDRSNVVALTSSA